MNSIENFATKYQLIENFKKNNPQYKEIELLQSIKELLHTSSVYERIKKSTLIVKIAMSLRNNERSLWPSTEIGIAKENTPLEKNKINLIKKIFEKISYEFGAKTDLFLIHIPYKVEVDKKFWSKTFGKHPEKFDQSGPEKKLISLITNKQIKFIPSVAKFRDKFNNEKKELYLKNDGHLNKFGNELVSEIVLENIEKYLQIKVVN